MSVKVVSVESYDNKSTDVDSCLMGFLDDGMCSSKTARNFWDSFETGEGVVAGLRTACMLSSTSARLTYRSFSVFFFVLTIPSCSCENTTYGGTYRGLASHRHVVELSLCRVQLVEQYRNRRSHLRTKCSRSLHSYLITAGLSPVAVLEQLWRS